MYNRYNNNNGNNGYGYNNNRYNSNTNGNDSRSNSYSNNGYNDRENAKNSSGSFENNPKLKNIDPLKIKIIMEIKEKSKYKSMEELLPEIMKINQELNRRQMGFTKNESELLLDAIEESLSPSERQKFQMIKSFMSIS